MEKIKIGVIGTGHLGKLHIKMLSSIDNCELVGIYDSNKNQLEAVSKEFDVKAFDNLEELLKVTECVSIAATTSAHYELAK